jgi:hypothetical protein
MAKHTKLNLIPEHGKLSVQILKDKTKANAYPFQEK